MRRRDRARAAYYSRDGSEDREESMGTRHTGWVIARACLAVVAFAVASCGDEDTTGPQPPPNEALKGDYFVVAYEHDVEASGPVCATGVLSFDGAGKFAGELALAFEGAVETDSISGNYDVGAQRGLVLTDDTG